MTGEEFADIHGYWNEHPYWLLYDWRQEIANDDTRQGYWDWVANQVQMERGKH